MDTVDNGTETPQNENVSTTDTSNNLETQPGTETQDQSTQNDIDNPEDKDLEKKTLTPFANGKETIKVRGKDVEVDWETTKRLASLGMAGRRAMQEKAQTEQKFKAFMGQLRSAAEKDPYELAEILTGKRLQRPHQNSQGQAQTEENQENIDPRYLQLMQKLEQQDQQIKELSGDRETRLVQQELQAIENEYSDVEKQFPELKGDKFKKQYIKDMYAKELRGGNEFITLEDIAFEVVMELRDEKKLQEKEMKARDQAKRAKTVLTTQQGSNGKSTEKKFRSFDDVRKEFGII